MLWRQILGGLIGGELQRQHGGNGVKGMVIGSLAMRAITRMGPLGWILGGAWAAKQMSDRMKAEKATAPPSGPVPPARIDPRG